ncbi:MAG TPA: chloride channel protein [Terrimicrobium sp.]
MTLNLRRNILQLTSTATIGLVAGLAAVAFHQAMIFLANVMVEAPSAWPLGAFAGFVLAAMGVAALTTGWLMKRFAPDAPGSGIPQVKVAYRREQLEFSWHLIWVKFLGGALSIGSGSSLGREGPTIHIGAAIASKIGKIFGEHPAARANAVCAGSAAGLAAAFGSPLAGVTLVLEEIAGGKNEENFAGRSLLAAALASSVVFAMSKGAPSLPVGQDLALSWRALWMSPVVAVAAGSAGLVFQYVTLAIRARCKHSPLSGPLKLVIGTLMGGMFALLAFALSGRLGAFGLGDQDLVAALNGNLIWTAALCLLVAKLLATAACYGAGGCGGIFAPLLFFGGMAGVLICGLTAGRLDLTSQDQTLLALTGMTACLGAVVRAPLTSILIVMEMTRQIYALPALMVAAVVSVFMNRLCFAGNFYDEALRQDGIRLEET